MGWAKSFEDNIKIYDDRQYMKGSWTSDFYKDIEQKYIPSQKKGSKNKIIQAPKKSNRTLEFEAILKHISHIEEWITFCKELLDFIQTPYIKSFLEIRREELLEGLDYYQNEYYKQEYEDLRKRSHKKIEVAGFRKIIAKDFVETCLSYFSELINRSLEDALELRLFYEDLEIYLQKEFHIKPNQIEDVGVIVYAYENILGKPKPELIQCKCCKQETYEIFNICIHCNDDRRERCTVF